MPKIPEFTEVEQAKLNQMYEAWMENDLKRKTENFNELNKGVVPGGIVFAGDSITEGYPLCEMFPRGHALYNRGISGETSKQLLDRINEQILDLKPSKVFLLIGTNDIERENNGNDVGKHISKICKKIETELPNSKVYIISVYPVNETDNYKGMIGTRTNQKILEINRDIKMHTLGMNVIYIDLYDDLSLRGNLNPKYTFDGLHLSIEGYRFVSKKFLPYIERH